MSTLDLRRLVDAFEALEPPSWGLPRRRWEARAGRASSQGSRLAERRDFRFQTRGSVALHQGDLSPCRR